MFGEVSDRLGVELGFAVGYVQSLLLCAQALHMELIPRFTPKWSQLGHYEGSLWPLCFQR